MMLRSKKYIHLSQRGRLVCSKPQEKSTAASFLGERAEYIIRLERGAAQLVCRCCAILASLSLECAMRRARTRLLDFDNGPIMAESSARVYGMGMKMETRDE
jgi:hypothetical protein